MSILTELRARAWAATKSGEHRPARALEIAAVEMLEVEAGALTEAANHARDLTEDLDRWKERASIFEARLARFAGASRNLRQQSDACRMQASVMSVDDSLCRLLHAKAVVYREASALIDDVLTHDGACIEPDCRGGYVHEDGEVLLCTACGGPSDKG